MYREISLTTAQIRITLTLSVLLALLVFPGGVIQPVAADCDHSPSTVPWEKGGDSFDNAKILNDGEFIGLDSYSGAPNNHYKIYISEPGTIIYPGDWCIYTGDETILEIYNSNSEKIGSWEYDDFTDNYNKNLPVIENEGWYEIRIEEDSYADEENHIQISTKQSSADKFSINDIQLFPKEPDVGEEFTVLSVIGSEDPLAGSGLEKVGDFEDTAEVSVKMNGETISTQTVSLTPEDTRDVEFSNSQLIPPSANTNITIVAKPTWADSGTQAEKSVTDAEVEKVNLDLTVDKTDIQQGDTVTFTLTRDDFDAKTDGELTVYDASDGVVESGIEIDETVERTFDTGGEFTIEAEKPDKSKVGKEFVNDSVDISVQQTDDEIEQPPNNGGRIALENVSASEGSTVPVSLTASGDVAGYSATINFDTTELYIESVSGEDLPSPATSIDNTEGTVTISKSQATAVTDPTLATLSVLVDGNSGSTLRFDTGGTTLNDENSARQIASYSNGEVTARECLPGDANDDGQLTPFDATQVNRKVVGASVAETFSSNCADINGDGSVTPLDATKISQKIVNTLSTATSTASTNTTTLTTASSQTPMLTQSSTDNTAMLSVGSVSGKVDEHVSIPVSVSNESISGYQTRVQFDSAVINVESVNGGDFNEPQYTIDNETGTVGFTQSRGSEIEDPVVANINATIIGQPGARTDLSIDQSETSINNNTVPGIKTSTQDGSVSVSTKKVQINNVTITPSTISSESSTHNITFETQGISSDGVQDNITISMPDAVELDEINSASVIDEKYEVDYSENDNNDIDLEVDPDKPVETVDLTIEVLVELSESSE